MLDKVLNAHIYIEAPWVTSKAYFIILFVVCLYSFFNTIFSLQDRTSQPIVVADGAGGVNESSTSSRQGSQAKSSPTLIECPYCSRSYPYHLIEGHVQDCMEDSLYMDD